MNKPLALLLAIALAVILFLSWNKPGRDEAAGKMVGNGGAPLIEKQKDTIR